MKKIKVPSFTGSVSVKHLLVDRANASIVLTIAIACASVAVCLVLCAGMVKQFSFRNRVIKEKNIAAKTLRSNSAAVKELVSSFEQFDNTQESLIGTTDKNSKLVLDALPSKYDFPALATSLEKILTEGGYDIVSLTGIDVESADIQQSSAEPVPVDMDFSISVSGPYDKVKNVVTDLERSIRPITISSIRVSGTSSATRIEITAKTYFQPARNIENKTKDIQ